MTPTGRTVETRRVVCEVVFFPLCVRHGGSWCCVQKIVSRAEPPAGDTSDDGRGESKGRDDEAASASASDDGGGGYLLSFPLVQRELEPVLLSFVLWQSIVAATRSYALVALAIASRDDQPSCFPPPRPLLCLHLGFRCSAGTEY